MKNYDLKLTKAFDFFNRELFEDKLEPCVISFQSKKGMLGCFKFQRYTEKGAEADKIDEISLNPDMFDRSEREVLSTLVHEMVHKWQFQYGEKSRSGYHNREWADKMNSIGLKPTDNGQEDGKETGQKMSHLIVSGDIFDLLAKKYLHAGFKIDWTGFHNKTTAKPRVKSKFKYTCPKCNLNAWAKKGTKLMCGEDESHLEMEDE